MSIVSSTQSLDDITSLIAAKAQVNRDNVFPFLEFTSFMTELFRYYEGTAVKVTSSGVVIPDISIAADRAELTVDEVLSHSPFKSNCDEFLNTLSNRDEIVYLSNPNRITGANYSTKELKRIIGQVTDGLIIIDEYYHDYFGITGASFVQETDNLVILRSFTSAFGIKSFEAGYAICSKPTANRLQLVSVKEMPSNTVRKAILATIMNDEAVSNHLKDVHNESLRIATALNKMGVQCRITAGDFLLLRVMDPKTVGNTLTKNKIQIENLDGYPQMNRYLKYQIQSPISNDRLLDAFRKMPGKYYIIRKMDMQKITLHKNEDVKKTKNERLRGIKKDDIKLDWINISNLNISRKKVEKVI